MNTQKLYYTPRIEEFYIGFEYEILNSDNAQWGSFLIKTVDDLITKFMRDEDEIRVKYLDKEDIENLKFTNIDNKLSSTKTKYYEYKNIFIIHILSINKLIIFTEDKIRTLKSINPTVFKRDILFKGIIKNKSELQILLKQLNVI